MYTCDDHSASSAHTLKYPCHAAPRHNSLALGLFGFVKTGWLISILVIKVNHQVLVIRLFFSRRILTDFSYNAFRCSGTGERVAEYSLFRRVFSKIEMEQLFGLALQGLLPDVLEGGTYTFSEHRQ
ncbi:MULTISPECIES: hypothetical protein [Pseudomonas]|uniref:hypothetical protein n=1 Tax=Pseudomonas TaxID=286 RepID=UPI0011C47928|nr:MULTISPECIES: hypothetical protein [Pseudomonas]